VAGIVMDASVRIDSLAGAKIEGVEDAYAILITHDSIFADIAKYAPHPVAPWRTGTLACPPWNRLAR